MLGRRRIRWANIETTLCLVFAGLDDMYPANPRHEANVGSMLAHRLRRWANIDPTLASCLVFAGYSITSLI